MDNLNFDDGVPFDPGYSKYLDPFTPTIEAIKNDLQGRRNFSQKKIRFNQLNKIALELLDNNISFYLGCILWGAYIRYKFQDNPKSIKNNSFLDLSKEDLSKMDYMLELDNIIDFIDNYPKDTKYFTGKEQTLPKLYKKVAQSYKEFVEINDNFLASATTADIKVPNNFMFIAEYNEEQLEEVYAKILEAIQNQKLTDLFNNPILDKI